MNNDPEYLDDLRRPVYDRTDEYNEMYGLDAIKVEQCESNVLVLFESDSEYGDYEIVYKWLSNPEYLECVQGQEVTYYKKDEIDPDERLFKQLSLVP